MGTGQSQCKAFIHSFIYSFIHSLIHSYEAWHAPSSVLFVRPLSETFTGVGVASSAFLLSIITLSPFSSTGLRRMGYDANKIRCVYNSPKTNKGRLKPGLEMFFVFLFLMLFLLV